MSALTPGSLVIERYVYTSPTGATGVQWLAQVVEADGRLGLMKACKTRRAALAVLAGSGSEEEAQ